VPAPHETAGGHLYLVCALCEVTILRHIHVSKSTFWQNLLAHYAYSSTRTLLILCVIALNINYQRYKGVKHTHHYVRALHKLQNQAARISRQIRAVEHRKCAAGLVGAHPGLQDRILPNYTRIENGQKYARNRSPGFPFQLLKDYRILERFYVNNCSF